LSTGWRPDILPDLKDGAFFAKKSVTMAEDATITFRLKAETKAELERLAAAGKRSLSNFIKMKLEEVVEAAALAKPAKDEKVS
jgi:uncharacterized protein (DUF1778 family)